MQVQERTRAHVLFSLKCENINHENNIKKATKDKQIGNSKGKGYKPKETEAVIKIIALLQHQKKGKLKYFLKCTMTKKRVIWVIFLL